MSEQPPKRNLKRQADVGVTEIGWNMMFKMGHEPGRGLGASTQGIVKPINVSNQKGRRGLGLSTAANESQISGSCIPSTDSSLRWTEGQDVATVDSDRKWSWCWHETTDSPLPEPNELSLKSILLSPTDPAALGSPIRDMKNQTKFCSTHLLTEMLKYKDQLDHIPMATVTESHERCNPYEKIKKSIFMNRAAVKLANMDVVLDGLFSNAAPKDSILYFADICAGPGGFSEYLLWRRCNAPQLGSSLGSSNTAPYPCLNAKGFGLTLTGKCDFREINFIAGPVEAFLAHYGPSQDGDITKWANLASFAALIDRSTKREGVHIVVADGGFSVDGQENLQEVLSKRIYLCQCLCALTILRPGGHFLIKLFDAFTEFTAHLIYLMGQVFERVTILQPVTSRPANSERYLVCENLLSASTRMAGCPPAPVSTDSENTSDGNTETRKSGFKQPVRKLPNQRRPNTQSHIPVNGGAKGEEEYGLLMRDEAGAVGELIEHFIAVNKVLGKQKSAPKFTSDGMMDASSELEPIRLCYPEEVGPDSSFSKFLKFSNEEFARTQCISLCKLLTFAHDQRLSEPRQTELKNACLEKWQIQQVERKQVQWPIMAVNHSEVIHGILGDKEKFHSLNSLRVDHWPTARMETFAEYDYQRQTESLVGTYLALICGTPSSSGSGSPSKPMLIYSRGSRCSDLHCTLDGEQWSHLDQVVLNLKVRLPAGTLVWGQSTNEYALKNGRRRYALTIYDAICIYGYDCRDLHYKKRMELVERMVDVVNYPQTFVPKIRVPPILNLRQLDGFIRDLPLLPCKDSSGNVLMHVYPDGIAFQPHSLLLVKHISDPWMEVPSRSTGQMYFFNKTTNESTFSSPPYLSFKKTSFISVPWHSNPHESPLLNSIERYLETMDAAM